MNQCPAHKSTGKLWNLSLREREELVLTPAWTSWRTWWCSREHLQAGEGWCARVDSEALEKVKETADAGTEPCPRHGQIPCWLHHMCYRGQPYLGLHWGWYLHRVQAYVTSWEQAQHHRDLSCFSSCSQSSRTKSTKTLEDVFSFIWCWIWIRKRSDSFSSSSSSDQSQPTSDQSSLETILI